MFLLTLFLAMNLFAEGPAVPSVTDLREPLFPWPKEDLLPLVEKDDNRKTYNAVRARDWEYAYPRANFDESKAGTLPVPSILVNPETGKKITSPDEWPALREIHLRNITRILYGELPPEPQSRRIEVLTEKDVFDGTATFRTIRLTLCNDGKEHAIDVLCYIPKRDKPVPAIVAMNIMGNQTTNPDPDIPVLQRRTPIAGRGAQQCRWDFRYLCDNGIAVITCSYYDFYPDWEFRRNESIFRLFHDESELKPTNRKYNAISAWAYGYSQLRKLAATFPEIDPKDIWAHGQSRLGKTAIWTVVNDPEWAGGVSNCSGCAGAALSRRNYGENLDFLEHFCPWWFTGELEKYAAEPETLPFDQHTLIALAAPRAILVAGAKEDVWADNHGQFLSVKYAQELYDFLGLPGLPSQEQPKTGESDIGPYLGFYERYGIHDVTNEDWKNTIEIIRKHSL